MSQESDRIVGALIDAWNRRDLHAALELMHPQCEVRPVETTETLHGHAGVTAAFEDWFEAFDEFTIDAEDFSAQGDHVRGASTSSSRSGTARSFASRSTPTKRTP